MFINEVLVGKFIYMRSVEECDAGFILKLRLDEHNCQFINKTENNLEKQIEWIRLQRLRENDYYFVFTDKNHNKAGVISIYNIEKNKAESGRFVSFGDSAQNMEALLMLYDFTFYKLGIELVNFSVIKENRKIANMWRRLGCPIVYEKKVNNVDSYYFELTKDRYENVFKPNIKGILDKVK